jgi:hypothetical protein
VAAGAEQGQHCSGVADSGQSRSQSLVALRYLLADKDTRGPAWGLAVAT